MLSRPFPLVRVINYTGVAIILALAIYGLVKLLVGTGGPGTPMVTHVTALTPVSRGEIISQFKVITVERQYRIPVVGTTYKPLPTSGRGLMGELARSFFGSGRVPGTTQNMVYEMVTTVTAGIDLSKTGEADVLNNDTITTITLPAPEVFTVAYDSTQSRIFSQDKPTLPYMGSSAELLEQMQRTGLEKHRAEAEADETLMAKAQSNAEKQLREFLQRVHPGRQLFIQFRKPGEPALPVAPTP